MDNVLVTSDLWLRLIILKNDTDQRFVNKLQDLDRKMHIYE